MKRVPQKLATYTRLFTVVKKKLEGEDLNGVQAEINSYLGKIQRNLNAAKGQQDAKLFAQLVGRYQATLEIILDVYLDRVRSTKSEDAAARFLRETLQRHDAKENRLEPAIYDLLQAKVVEAKQILIARQPMASLEFIPVDNESASQGGEDIVAITVILVSDKTPSEKFQKALEFLIGFTDQGEELVRQAVEQIDSYARGHYTEIDDLQLASMRSLSSLDPEGKTWEIVKKLQTRVGVYQEVALESPDVLAERLRTMVEGAQEIVAQEKASREKEKPADFQGDYARFRLLFDFALQVFVDKSSVGLDQMKRARGVVQQIQAEIPEQANAHGILARHLDTLSKGPHLKVLRVKREAALESRNVAVLLENFLDRYPELFSGIVGEGNARADTAVIRRLIQSDPMLLLDYLLAMRWRDVQNLLHGLEGSEVQGVHIASLGPLVQKRKEALGKTQEEGAVYGRQDLLYMLIPFLHASGDKHDFRRFLSGEETGDEMVARAFRGIQQLDRFLQINLQDPAFFEALVRAVSGVGEETRNLQAETIDLDALAEFRDGKLMSRDNVNPLYLQRLRRGNVVVFSSRLDPSQKDAVERMLATLAPSAKGIVLHLANITQGDAQGWQEFRGSLQEKVSEVAGVPAERLPFGRITVMTTTENYLKYWRDQANQFVFFLLGTDSEGRPTVTMTGQMIETLRVVLGEERFNALKTEITLDDTTKIFFTPATSGRVQEMFLQQRATEIKA